MYDGNGTLKYYLGYWTNRLRTLEVESLTVNSRDVVITGGTTDPITNMGFIFNENPYIEAKYFDEAYGIEIWQSDKRLKDNIQDSQYNALDKVMRIRHRSFDYKKGKHVNLGYVADELQEIDSDFVIEIGEDKMKQPLPKALIPLLSKAIQEQQEIIEKLKSRINELEKKVNTNE